MVMMAASTRHACTVPDERGLLEPATLQPGQGKLLGVRIGCRFCMQQLHIATCHLKKTPIPEMQSLESRVKQAGLLGLTSYVSSSKQAQKRQN